MPEVEEHERSNKSTFEVEGEGTGVSGSHLDDEEEEDEESLFAKHDGPTSDGGVGFEMAPTRSRNFLVLPVLCFVLVGLLIAAVVLAVVFRTSTEESLLKCTPQKVDMPPIEAMTLDEKIGQMLQVDHLSLASRDDITTYFIGSVLSGGGGAPRWGNKPSDWADLVDDLQARAAQTRLKIPIVYGADAVHGHSNVYGTTIFPHHVGMGASRNPALMQRVASIAAQEVMGTGVRWTFSPAVSVCRDPRWGRCYESFGDTPGIVSIMSLPEILGFQILPDDWPASQDQNPKQEQGIFIAATAKHYIGDGGTDFGHDRGDTIMAEQELRDMFLAPYTTAVSAGVMSIMVSYSSWNGVPMHENKFLITDVLKTELGFEGVVVSDWGAVELLPGEYSEQVERAINAGIDMVMAPKDFKLFISTLKDLVQKNVVPMSRIDDAVSRILDLKKALALYDNSCARREFLTSVGAEHHRIAAREAVRETLVCLKNSLRSGQGSPVFPLALEGKSILVVGRHANDIGLQCGGWTISWQGSAGSTTTGTTIFDGFKEVLATTSPTTKLTHQEVYDKSTVADYGIVVVGEDPYAEYHGDSQSLSLNKTNSDPIQKVCAKMPCVVILITGRSIDIAPLLEVIDALVVAWLPGTEGAGVADVIFGTHDFKGRLPYPWFKSISQIPFTASSQIDALFTEGFGLDKNANVVLGFP